MFTEIGFRVTGRQPGRARWSRRLPLLCAVTALVSSATLIGGINQAQAATPVSEANGQFLSGSALGIDLNSIVSVQPATTTNVGGPASTVVNPLSVSALQAVDVDLGNGVNLLGSNPILQLGAVNQYAHAAPDGSSQAASGAVDNSGAVGVGGSPGFPANATLNLTPVLTPALTSALSTAGLTVGALSSTATQTAAGTQSGTYQIAALTLTLNSPLVKGVYTGLRTTLVGLQPTVNGLPALIRALPGVGPLATITGVPNLATVVDTALGSVTTADGSIVADLKTGDVSIDVAKLLTSAGLDLNNLPADTELLPYITAGLTSQLLPAITTALTGLNTQLTNAINGISVTVLGVPVALAVLAPVLNPVIAQLVAPVNAVASGLGSTVITPLATALTTLLSLQANTKENNADGSFTERALSLTVLPTGTPALAQVNLASSTVGPNAGPAAPPTQPTATGITPNSGPVAGGQNVTVTGTDFVAGATTVTIGGNTVSAANVTVNSPTSLTFSTPAHPAGPVGVTVTTAGGTSTPALDYTYVAAPITPTALSLTPTTGPVSGGQTVSVNGSGFVAGATSVTIGGTTIPATDVSVIDASDLSFVTPAHAAGPVGVTVTTAGGTSTPALDYTYVTGPITPEPPVALSLSPTAGPVAGGQTVSINGNNFVGGATSVSIGGITVPATAVDVTSASTLTFVTPAHAAGPVGVTVTTPAGTSSPALDYTYETGPVAPQPPVALNLSPDSGPTTGSQTVSINGQNFVAGNTSVNIGGTVVPASAVTVVSPTALSFSTPAHAAGPVEVTVTTDGGTSSPALQYTYVTGPVTPQPPTALGLSPDHGPVAGGQIVTVSGSGFVAGQTTVNVDGASVPAIVTSTTSLTYPTPAHPAGAADVTVTTPNGTSSPALQYTYETGPITPEPPVALTLSPDNGPTTGGQSVAISGSGFVAGQTSVTIGGITVPAAAVSVVSPTGLTFTTPAHAAGPVGVTVTTPNGTSSPALQYTYETGPITPQPPTALGLSPTTGPVSGGQTVTVNGSGFIAGQTSVTIGGTGVPAANVSVTSATSLSFPTPAHAAGPVDVTVTTPNGTSSPALQYTYETGPITPEPPVVYTIAPNSGPTAGGQTVAITGNGFVDGATSVTIGGVTVPAGQVSVISPTAISFPTPAHVAGAVDVTVTTPNGTSSPALQYTYVSGPVTPQPPVALQLNPTSGPVTGGQTVAVTGIGFVPGQTTISIGGVVVPAAGVAVSSPTALTFTTPAHAAGPVDVTVTTPNGTSSPALQYTYETGPITTGTPTTLGLNPTSGPVDGGQTVAITGSNFVAGSTTVSIGGVTVPAAAVTVVSPIALIFTTPAHAAGPVDVTVTTPNGTSSPALTYTYQAGPVGPTAPVALAVSPSSGPAAGGQTVTVTGAGFVDGATTVTIGGVTVPAGSVIVTSGTSLRFVTPPHAAGAVGITVTTTGGTSSPPLSYTYLPDAVVPPVTLSITPAAGPATGGQTVTITGAGFVSGATSVTIGATTIPVGSVTVLSPVSLRFKTPAHAAGAVGVTVTTPSGTSSPALTYRYLPAVPVKPPAPVISTPKDGATIQDPSPIITGTGVPGDSVNVHEGSTPLCTAVVQSDGTWMCQVQTVLTDGQHTINASQTDPAGLSSVESDPHTFTLDANGILGTDANNPGSGTAGDGTNGSDGSGGGNLAYTGTETLNLMVLALALLAIGGWLAVVARRPKQAAGRNGRG